MENMAAVTLAKAVRAPIFANGFRLFTPKRYINELNTKPPAAFPTKNASPET